MLAIFLAILYVCLLLTLCLCMEATWSDWFVCEWCRNLQPIENIRGYWCGEAYCASCELEWSLSWCYSCRNWRQDTIGRYCEDCWEAWSQWYTERRWYWVERIYEESEAKKEQ